MQKNTQAVNPENLKLSAIQKQLWHNDRAFKHCLTRGEEKGFSSMEDYITRSNAYRNQLRASRKGKKMEGGERRSLKFAVSLFAHGLKPILWIVGFIVFTYLLLSNHFFLPVSKDSVFIMHPKVTPTALVHNAPTPTPHIGNTSVSLDVTSPKETVNIRGIATTVALSISFVFFILIAIRKFTKRKKKASEAANVPEPEEAGSVE